MSREIDDLQLIDRVLAGEQNVYAQLVERYKGYAFAIALKVLGVRPEAEEAAQDAFVKAYHNLAKFNREAKFSTWLYRIVFNTAISLRRTRKVTFQDIPETVAAHGHDTEKTLEKSDKERFIQMAMARLNEADRVALTLFYLRELSLEEIGAITGMPANTVKVRIHRARLRLAEEMKTILKHEALLL